MRRVFRALLTISFLSGATLQASELSMHRYGMEGHAKPAMHEKGEDGRIFVKFPDKLRVHMLNSMRDHLVTLNEILADLSAGKMDAAAEKAESRLGMGSLELHGAAQAAPYMPEGMRRAGMNLHKAASRFARKAEEEDLPGSYKALTAVTASCVACHASYRVQ